MCDKFWGWSNRETWALVLHIENDPGLHRMAREEATLEVEGHDKGEEINPFHLGERLVEWLEENVFSYENIKASRYAYEMMVDVGSLYRIDYREVGNYYLEQVKEEEKV